MEMLKVYGLPNSTNTARVLVSLKEKGVDYQLIHVDILASAHKQHPFISLNPFGLLPALEDGDLNLFESRAITKYVAGKYKESEPDLLRYKSLAESAMVDVWLEVESQQFGPSISALVYEILIKPYLGSPTDAEAVEEQKEKLSKVLDIYEERLSKCRYLAGDYFTLADLNHLPHICNLFKTPMDSLITSRPHVFSWWQDISSRPAWRKIEEGLIYT